MNAVLDEDAQGVAVSSYQGGHVEYFEYLAELLAQSGAGQVRVFGGGGGVIVPEEIQRLGNAGVRIFSPEDGQRLGLPGMINELIRDCDTDLAAAPPPADAVLSGERRALARTITCLQEGRLPDADRAAMAAAAASRRVQVLGITGTGGSGKSSLTDELIRRLRTDPPARATRSAPTVGSSCYRRVARPPGCQRRSTRSPCMAATRAKARTCTARSAPPESRSRPWRT